LQLLLMLDVLLVLRVLRMLCWVRLKLWMVRVQAVLWVLRVMLEKLLVVLKLRWQHVVRGGVLRGLLHVRLWGSGMHRGRPELWRGGSGL
jgi:hypothetical protein